MSAYHTAQALRGLRAVLTQLHTERERFPDAPLSAAGVFLDYPARADPLDRVHPEVVARFLAVPAEAVEQVQGVEFSTSWDPTYNGPFFVFLPATPDAPPDPRREIARQLTAFHRAVRPLADVLRQLPAEVRSRLPAEPSGWWAVLFHLAIHYPRAYLRADRVRWVNVTGTAPGVDPQRTLLHRSPHECPVPELRFQLGHFQAPCADIVPEAVWTRLAEGDIFTATAAAVELLVEWLDRPLTPPPDPDEVRRRFAALHAQFAEYAERDRRRPRPAPGHPPHLDWTGRCLLVKVADSFRTPPAREWCDFPLDLAFERELLSRHHADAEYLLHRNMPGRFRALCEEAGAALPPAIFDGPVMFARRMPGDDLPPNVVGGWQTRCSALNPHPLARWVRFVFNALCELDPSGGSVEVRFLDPPPDARNPFPNLYGYAALPDGFFASSARAIELAGLLPAPTPPADDVDASSPVTDLGTEADTPPDAEADPPAGALVPRCNGRLLCSSDCGVVVRGEETFTLPPNPRAVIAYMIAAWEARPREFTQRELLDVCESVADRLRDVFRSGGVVNPAWEGLIVTVEGRRGFYELRTE